MERHNVSQANQDVLDKNSLQRNGQGYTVTVS